MSRRPPKKTPPVAEVRTAAQVVDYLRASLKNCEGGVTFELPETWVRWLVGAFDARRRRKKAKP